MTDRKKRISGDDFVGSFMGSFVGAFIGSLFVGSFIVVALFHDDIGIFSATLILLIVLAAFNIVVYNFKPFAEVISIWRRRTYKTTTTDQASATPSRRGRRLLLWFLPKDQREHLPGDLDEEFFTIILPELGPRYAKLWYWWQVIRSILATNKWFGWLVSLVGFGSIATAISSMLKRRNDD